MLIQRMNKTKIEPIWNTSQF